ncbi:MAG: glutaredoxin/malate transporter fusion protein [Actinomycetia bacterium]|nr:glutaredoxin/malate transporter fusion protein [Actinomycetes bacterium]
MTGRGRNPDRVGRVLGVFGFPNPVDEVSARLVAGGVLVMGVAALVTRNPVLLAVLAYGFVARVLTGPRLSPLGRLVTQVVRPRLAAAPTLVAGPPKRFAQGVGAAFTVSALVLTLTGFDTAAGGLLAVLVVFATLESVFAFCMGCTVFGWLMRAGVIPESVCLDCADISRRIGAGSSVG